MFNNYKTSKHDDQTSPIENIEVTASLEDYVEAEKVAQALSTQYSFSEPDDSGDYLLVNHDAGDATVRIFDDEIVMEYTPPAEYDETERERDQDDLTYALESLGKGQESRVDLDAVLDPQPAMTRDMEYDFAELLTKEELPEYGLPSSGMPKRR